MNQDHIYLLCSYNWNGFLYNMPWSAQLDNYYNYFGNGYVPYFAVIGADYYYIYGSNNVSGAINAAEAAMENIIVYPQPENLSAVISYPQINLLWQAPQTNMIIYGYNIYHNNTLIANLPQSQLFFSDSPQHGNHLYTVRTQYQENESQNSNPVNVPFYNTPGDVDANLAVEAFDASLVLHYAVNNEPQILPFPWQQWRIDRADVDENGDIEAYDSALILQFVVSIITTF